MFYYSIHPNFVKIWTLEFFTTIQEVTQYFGVDHILRQKSVATQSILLYSNLLIHFVAIVSISMLSQKFLGQKNFKSSTLATYSLQVINLYFIILETVLMIPAFQIFFVGFYCTSSFIESGDCHTTVWYINFGLSGFGMILL